MKLFVEMTEEEYEKYKRFSNGDYAEPSGKREDIYRYLFKSGFKEVRNSAVTFIDPISGDISASIKFEKGDTMVKIVQGNVQKYEEAQNQKPAFKEEEQ